MLQFLRDAFKLNIRFATLIALILYSASFAQGTFTEFIIDATNPQNPHNKTLGDINGDGFPDALAASSVDDGLFWYEYPSWTKHPIRSAGGWTTDMQTGDIDNDGDIDIVIPNDTGVIWYENPSPSGDPAIDFWNEFNIGAAGANNHDVELGDMNNDGRLDVVTRKKEGGLTNVFLQINPTSWVQIVASTSAGEGTSLGDIDNDADLDIAHNGFWLENLGGGTSWVEHLIDSNWPAEVGVLVLDINNDGRNDVVIGPSESANGRLSWYEATDPKFGPWTEHIISNDVSYLHTFKAGDMDKNGTTDLVTAEMHQSSDPDEVSVYYNDDGTGLVWSQQVLATIGSHNIRLGDIAVDGDLDIFGANWKDDSQNRANIRFWQNNIDNKLSLDSWIRHLIDGSLPWKPVFVEYGDIDNDGLKDIITGGWWYKNPGTLGGIWLQNTIVSSLNNMAAVYDFDNDGDLDILGTDGVPTGANFSWAQNDGSGTFTHFTNIPSGMGDFLQGVAVARYQAGAPIEIALSWHASATAIEMLTVPTDPTLGTWPLRQIHSNSQFEALSAKDIDRDGDTDLFQGTYWLQNDGSGNYIQFLVASIAGHPDRNRLADINKDGRLDAVIGFEESNSELIWLEAPENATQTWTIHTIASGLIGTFSMDVADVDLDGDIDVIHGEHNGGPNNRVTIFENLDNGTDWTAHIVDTGGAGIDHHDGTQPADLDGDGDLDIMSIGWINNKLWLYENKAVLRANTVATPLISPNGGTFSGSVTVTLSTTTIEADIYYTTDGLIPDTTSDLYSSPFILTDDVTVQAKAFKTDLNPSEVASAIFTALPLDTTPPEEIVSLTLTNLSTTTLDLTWTAPGDDGDIGTASSYDIRQTTTAPSIDLQAWWDAAISFVGVPTPQSAGSTEIFTATGLLPATTYYLVVRALDEGTNISPLSLNVIQSATTTADNIPPEEIVSLVLSNINETSVDLNWIAPGDDGSVGTTSYYNIRYSTTAPGGSPQDWWDAASSLSGAPTPLLAGSTESFTASGLAPDTFYYFAVRALDEVLNISPITINAISSAATAPDITPPTVSIISPADGNTVSGTIFVTADASDNFAVEKVEFYVDDLLQSTVSSSPYSFPLDTSSLSDDLHTFQADAFDSSNNTTSHAISVTVNNSIPSNLVAHWPFDEGNGTTTADVSSNDHTATLVNGPVWTTGQTGNAINFDGSNDLVNAGNFDVTGNQLTLTAWMNADQFTHLSSRDSRIIAKTTDTASQAHYWMLSTIKSGTTDTRLRFRLKTGASPSSGTTTLIASSGNLATNSWTHVAAVYDGVTMTLYKDGFAVGSTAKSGNIATNSAVFVAIANNPPGGGSVPFDGTLDDIRIYGQALSAQEIQALATGAPDTTPPLISNIKETNITISSATINWDTNEPADSQVEYGLTTSYGSETALNPTLVTTDRTQTLLGLQANTLYHYQAKSKDGAGNLTLSDDQSFTTIMTPDTTPPEEIVSLTLINPSTTTLDLTWTAPGDDDNVGTASTYDIRHSTTAPGGEAQVWWDTAISFVGVPAPQSAGSTEVFTATGLLPATTYYLAVRALDEDSNISLLSVNAIQSAITTTDTTPPEEIVSLALSNISETSFDLNWIAPGDDGSVGTAFSYNIRHSTTAPSVSPQAWWDAASSLSGAPTPQLAGSTESFTASGLAPDISYYFAVRAQDEVLNMSPITINSITSATTAPDTTSPTVSITSPADGNTVSGTIFVTADASDNFTVDRVEFYVDGLLQSTVSSNPYNFPLDTSTLSDDLHTLRADAFDSSNNTTSHAISVTVNNSIPSNLVAHWPFDEGNGTTTADISGNDHTATLINGPVWTTGKTGNAINFDGSNDLVNAGNFDVTGNQLTLTAWMNADQFTHLSSRDSRIIAKTTDTAVQAHYWMLSTIKRGKTDTRLRFRLKTGTSPNSGTTTLIASSGNLATNSWIHVAAVYDGVTMTLYKDGLAVGSTEKSGNIATNSAVVVAIANNPPGGGSVPFDGTLDDIRVYDRALSAQDIQALVTAASDNTPP